MTAPLGISCPYCDAGPGLPCRGEDGPRDTQHRIRTLAAGSGRERCGTCQTLGWLPAGGGVVDPLTVTCSACLAPPGARCYATSTDEPRLLPHRLRGLGAAPTLRRCPDCGGAGWAPAVPEGEQRCGARTVFWPDMEACDAECGKPRGHDGPHEDESLGEWTDDELATYYPEGEQ